MGLLDSMRAGWLAGCFEFQSVFCGGGDGGLIQTIIWHLKVWEENSCINEHICSSGHIGTFPSDGRNSKVLQPLPPPPGGEVDLEELPLLQSGR